MNGNKGIKIFGITVVALILAAAALYLIDVDQTKEMRLPSVDIDVEGGQVPEFDIDVADINIGSKEVAVPLPNIDVETKTIEVEVPVDVDANMEESTITLPTIEIKKPREDDPANNPE